MKGTIGRGAWLAGTAAVLACHVHGRAGVDASTAELVAVARAGTERYRSLEAARADGYRRVGGDFPAMGEHWVSFRRVMADTFVPGEPPVLTYVRVGGVPRLVGVAYTALLQRGEQPPAFVPASRFWHEHNGSIVEESFALDHTVATHDDDTRLAILHAWIWSANPAGVFVTENWTLPFARVGLAPPADAAPAAARSIALAAGSEEYYRQAIAERAGLTESESRAMDGVLGRARRRIDSVLATAQRRRRLTLSDAEELAAAWEAIWEEGGRVLPGRELRDVRRILGGSHEEGSHEDGRRH